jgi:uncharacterized membrane protein YebE (DUF533 family)
MENSKIAYALCSLFVITFHVIVTLVKIQKKKKRMLKNVLSVLAVIGLAHVAYSIYDDRQYHRDHNASDSAYTVPLDVRVTSPQISKCCALIHPFPVVH